MTCLCGCLRSTPGPAAAGWVQVTDWSGIHPDDTRPDSAVTEWFATRRCLYLEAERRLSADLSAAISGEANERLARGDGEAA